MTKVFVRIISVSWISVKFLSKFVITYEVVNNRTFDSNGVELILIIFGLPCGGDFTWLSELMVVTEKTDLLTIVTECDNED